MPPKDPYSQLVEAFDQLPGIGQQAARRLTDACLSELQGAAACSSSNVSGSHKGVGTLLAESLSACMSDGRMCSSCRTYYFSTECEECRQSIFNENSEYILVETQYQSICLRQWFERRGKSQSTLNIAVLHGLISPTLGVGPEQIGVKTLISWLNKIPSSNVGTSVSLVASTDLTGKLTQDFLQRALNKVRTDIEIRLVEFDAYTDTLM